MTKIFSLLIIILMVVFFTNCKQQNNQAGSKAPESQKLSGSYLGQEPPGLFPEIFAPGIISTGMEELNLVFSPGGRELIVSVSYGSMRWALVGMKEQDGIWSEPEVLPFSGLYSDVDACISPDGTRVWFSSNRPLNNIGKPKEDFDIWYVDKTKEGWSKPLNPGPSINSKANEFFPCIVSSGAIYFQSRRESGPGSADIFRCEFKDGKFAEAIPLPSPINNDGFQGDTYVSPDESYAIISTTPDGKRGWSDLFVSFKDEHGQWSQLINMGTEVNSALSENTPFISFDGKYLFYKSRKRNDLELGQKNLNYHDLQKTFNQPGNGNADIYWVDAQIIKNLKSDNKQ